MIPGTRAYIDWQRRDAAEAACAQSLSGTQIGNPKDRVSQGKPGIHDIPLSALLHVGKVMKLGREKYGPCNWRGDAVRASVYIDAMFRHLARWWDGESMDPESGASHLAHIAAGCLIVMDAADCDQLIDDRPPGGPAVEVIEALTADTE